MGSNGGFSAVSNYDGKPALMSAKDKAFSALYDTAHAVGMVAGEAVVPTPMTVVGGVPGGPSKRYYVSEGACGFAWVKVRPANSPFANFLKKFKGVRKSYNGGVDIWVSEFNQSVARKEAYAYAFAKVLSDAGINAYSDSRLD